MKEQEQINEMIVEAKLDCDYYLVQLNNTTNPILKETHQIRVNKSKLRIQILTKLLKDENEN